MTKEKLTIKNILSNIYTKNNSIEKEIKGLLKQIRDEIFYELNTSTESRNVDIKNIFNKYINEK